MNAKQALWALMPPLLVAGCSGVQSVVPQQSTLSQVHSRMGRPTDIHIDSAGNEVWEYATGPVGDETYLVRAAKDGRVIDVAQVLTPAQFAKVARNVSTKAQVRELLGRPSEQQYFGDEAVWSWRMRISPQRGYYSVRFNREGVAIETLTLMDPSGDQRDGGSRGGR